MPGVLLTPEQQQLQEQQTKLPPPAPKVVGPTTKEVTRPSQPIPQYLVDEARATPTKSFDASHHITFQEPESIISMADIGLEGHGISPNAVTAPFPLFSSEAIGQIRREAFSEEVLEDCQFSSTFIKHMIRGMGPDRAPFTYAAWHSPEVIAAVSKVAGIDLIPSMDNETANINVSANPDPAPTPEVGVVGEGEVKPKEDDGSPLGDGLSTVAWHYDSFPFVCVVMLSSCEGMVGGETAMRTASGDIMKVRGPAMGTAVVMQGRYIEHQALKALGGRERISMVTCFRPRDPLVRDETVLTGVRGISHKHQLFAQYAEYRLEMLEARVQARRKADALRESTKRPIDVKRLVDWLREQRDFVDSMITELSE